MEELIKYLNNDFLRVSSITSEKFVLVIGELFEYLNKYYSIGEKKIQISFEKNLNPDSFELHTAPREIICVLVNTSDPKVLTSNQLKSVHETISNVIFSDFIPDKIKIHFLLEFNEKFTNKIDEFGNLGDKEVRRSFYNQAIKIIDNIIEQEILIHDKSNLEDQTNLLIQLYSKYLSQVIDTYILSEEYILCREYILVFIKNCTSKFRYRAFRIIIRINDLFTLIPKIELQELIIEYCNDLSNENSDELIFLNSCYPARKRLCYYQFDCNNNSIFSFKQPNVLDDESMKIFDGISTQALPAIEKTNFSKNDITHTAIEFVLPFTFSNCAFQIVNGPVIEFTKINKLNHHPYFSVFKEIYPAGHSIGHYLDIPRNTKEYMQVRVIYSGCIENEFQILSVGDEIQTKDYDFSNQEALSGNQYLPTKQMVLNLIREIYPSLNIPKVALVDINYDVFSSFRITYIQKIGTKNSGLLSRTYFFTSDKIFDRMSRIQLEIESGLLNNAVIFEKLASFQIINGRTLQNFIELILVDKLNKDISDRDGYKYFWSDKECLRSPKKEIDVQSYVDTSIRLICEMKGIQFSREAKAAGGQMDYLFSFNNNNRIYKVCVEIKNAHHAKIVEAPGNQLKAYMDAEGTRYGIYISLWYKNSVGFDAPVRFENTSDLKSAIDKRLPDKYDIKTVILNCNKPIPPSKRK